jgi:hypothetical protein
MTLLSGVHQPPVGQAVGHQLHGADLVSRGGVHRIEHFACDFGLIVIMKLPVHAGHRLDIAGNHQQVVADHQDGDLFVQLSEKGVKIRLAPGIDAGRGLVHQEQPGARHEGPGDEYPLALAGGKLPDFPAGIRGHAEAVEGRDGVPPVGCRRQAPAFLRVDVSHQDHVHGRNGKAAVRVDILRDISDAG